MNSKEEQLTKAILLATTKHAEQRRVDGSLYIYHPLHVAEMVKNYGYNIDYQIAAVLHDILEDTDITEEELTAEYGTDIAEAIKCLTRNDGENENDYVSRVLSNRIATVVKNADKIHNVWEASICKDKRWGQKYIDKAHKYYHGKFTEALDKAIGGASWERCVVNHSLKSYPVFSKNEMRLYSDIEKERYEEAKELYERYGRKYMPNIENDEMQFWLDESENSYFCYMETPEGKLPDNAWYIANSGWVPIPNPLKKSEYGEGYYPATREEVKAGIDKMIAQGNYFYDFVDTSILWN